MKRLSIEIVCFVACAAHAASDFATGAYDRVVHVWSDYVSEGCSPEAAPFHNCADAIDGGLIYGVSEEEWRRFRDYTETVSNNCAEIVADWRSYETNEMVRFTTLNAIVYSGLDNYTNCIENLLSRYEADTNYFGLATMRFLAMPYGTMEGEYLLANHYDEPAVSNMLVRLRALADKVGCAYVVRTCNATLSGERKALYDKLKPLGLLWP